MKVNVEKVALAGSAILLVVVVLVLMIVMGKKDNYERGARNILN